MAEYELDWFKLMVGSRSITHSHTGTYAHVHIPVQYTPVLSNCICAYMCTPGHTQGNDEHDSLTGAIVKACLKRGFGRTSGELAGSESSVLDVDDKVLAVCVLTTA